MNKLLTILLGSTFALHAGQWQNDDGTTTNGTIIPQTPIVKNIPASSENATTYQYIPDVAQYKLADWKNLIGVVKNVSVEQAKAIADQDPNITFFFYVKGGQMVLENNQAAKPYARVFHHRDAVFFSGTPWWGSAPELADGYIKQ